MKEHTSALVATEEGPIDTPATSVVVNHNGAKSTMYKELSVTLACKLLYFIILLFLIYSAIIYLLTPGDKNSS